MMKTCILAAGICAAALTMPQAALAQSQLDRFEALSERMMELMVAGLIEQQPALNGLLPATIDYDRPARRAARCTLNGYEDLVGEDGVEAMLVEFETVIQTARPADVISPNFAAGRPEGLTPQVVQGIQNDCRLAERQLQLLNIEGAMQALQSQ